MNGSVPSPVANERFAEPIYVGQNNLPDWERVEAAFRGIFRRRFFANGGPLVRELDETFARTLAVAHSISVTNESVALMILLKALEISGEVIVPAVAPALIPQALWWAGLTPVLCDVDPQTFMHTPHGIAPHITHRTSAVLAVRVFGRPDHSEELEPVLHGARTEAIIRR